jgi:high-affinity Fe2+/Pb2+ permease
MPAAIGLVVCILIGFFTYQERASLADFFLSVMLLIVLWVVSDIYSLIRRNEWRNQNGKAEKKSGDDKSRGSR